MQHQVAGLITGNSRSESQPLSGHVPDQILMEFLQETYAAAADKAGWDRAALERAS